MATMHALIIDGQEVARGNRRRCRDIADSRYAGLGNIVELSLPATVIEGTFWYESDAKQRIQELRSLGRANVKLFKRAIRAGRAYAELYVVVCDVVAQ